METSGYDDVLLSNLVGDEAAGAPAPAEGLERHTQLIAEAHRQHLDAVHLDLMTEIKRLRGEVLALREEMTTSHNKVLEAVRGLRAPIRRVAGKVDDLWRSDRGVARLVRRGEAKGANAPSDGGPAAG